MAMPKRNAKNSTCAVSAARPAPTHKEDAKHRGHRNGSRKVVLTPRAARQTLRAKRIERRRQEMDEGGRDDDAGAKVARKVVSRRRDA